MTETERWLCEYPKVKQRIRELELQIDEIKAKKESIYDDMLRGVQPEKDRVSGGPLYDPVIQAVTQLIDVYGERIKKLAGDLAAANAMLAQVEDAINQSGLTEAEMRYIRLRYFDGMPAWKAAQKAGYSDRQGRRIREKLFAVVQMQFG